MENLIYNIITYLIILAAVGVAGRKIYIKNFVKKESSCSTGCGGCSTKCELKEFAKTAKTNQ